MRLLNTQNLTLQEFHGRNIPRYAILSHRWGDAEVSYQDYRDGKLTDGSGFSKILELCKLAKSRGHEWTWIDTCCIDKTSSAELTESINSMWAWYRKSIECYVYMADMPDWVQLCSPAGQSGIDTRSEKLDNTSFQEFRRSRWFSRGWTLQELIAPNQVLFCTSAWRILGSKGELAQKLSVITGIQAKYLNSPDLVREASIAMRMSWAARRETTRLEDIAYCLLGLFDVNMSMLYGEGMEAAFMRLQRKIIKKYDDESIFAWARPGIDLPGPTGMLATSPSVFRDAKNVIALDIPPEQKLQYQMTNKGLELRIPSSPHDPTRDRTPDAHSDDPGRSRGYAQLATKIPSEKKKKRFQLACGFLSADTTGPVDPSKYPVGAISVIRIVLVRTHRGWKRSRWDQFDTYPQFKRVDGFSRSLYYVTQGELTWPMLIEMTPDPLLSVSNSTSLRGTSTEYKITEEDNDNEDDSGLKSTVTDRTREISVLLPSEETVTDILLGDRRTERYHVLGSHESVGKRSHMLLPKIT